MKRDNGQSAVTRVEDGTDVPLHDCIEDIQHVYTHLQNHVIVCAIVGKFLWRLSPANE